MKRSSLLRTAVGLFTAGSLLLGCQNFPEYYNKYKLSKAKEEITQRVDYITQTIEDFIFSKKALKEYGKNITYFDFSKLPEELIPKEKIRLPKDLGSYLKGRHQMIKVKDRQKFRSDFWMEAVKLDYMPETFEKMTVKEAIKAAVDIVASRFEYTEVDEEKNWFNKKYGSQLNIEEYFHLKYGDCDKYRDAVMLSFDIIKEFNKKLDNIYLSWGEELGGILERHAWIAILIPREGNLILSHIDPTFYDNNGELEASKDKEDPHILIYNEAFKAYLYQGIKSHEYACELFEESISKTKDEKTIEIMLKDMSFSVLLMDDKKMAVEKIEWLTGLYESKNFKKGRDTVLYYSYKVHKSAGNKGKSEAYLQKLLKEFPESYWTEIIKKGED